MKEKPRQQNTQQQRSLHTRRRHQTQNIDASTNVHAGTPRRTENRHDEERRRQRLVVAVAAIILLVIAAVPAYGYYQSFVLPPRTIVTTANDTEFTLGQVYNQLRAYQAVQEQSGMSFQLSSLPFQILSSLENNEIIRQQSQNIGVYIEPHVLNLEIQKLILDATEEELNLEDPKTLAKEFDERYTQYLDLIRMSEEEHRELVRAGLLTTALIDHLGKEISTVQEQVHLHRIIVETEIDVQYVNDELAEGKNVAELVASVGLDDAQTTEDDGDLGWVPRGIYLEVDKSIFDELEVGQPVEAIPSNEGWFIYVATERAQERQVDEDKLESLRAGEYIKWIDAQRENTIIERCFGSGGDDQCNWQYDWLVKQLQRSSNR
jgi:parvulin-like peptidyl-prolyl isomerase